MNNIADIYSLSPSQQGLLFHSVYEPESRVYYQQLGLRINGTLDKDAFITAWKTLIKRHSVMRTAFLWEELNEAYQVVQNEVGLPLTEIDWRDKNLNGDTLQDHINQLEAKQRQEVLDLNQAPMIRLCLVRLGEQDWHFVWTFHHILMDGWSVGVAMHEWLQLYQTHSCGETLRLPSVRDYKDYIGWLSEQKLSDTENFWRSQLNDMTSITPLPNFASSDQTQYTLPYAERKVIFTEEQSAALSHFARTQRITVNTLFQGAWALLLGQHAALDQVVYGVTVSGRPDELSGSDTMVGLFINTLPLNCQWADNPILGEWLRHLQAQNSEIRHHAYLPIAKLKPFSQVPAEQALFESILVFENYPIAEALNEGDSELRFSIPKEESNKDTSNHHRAEDDILLTRGRNHFPLSLMVFPNATLEFVFSYERQRFTDDEIAILSQQLKSLLLAFIAQAEQPVKSLQWSSDTECKTLSSWSNGEVLPTPQACLHKLFEQQAQKNPDHDALITQHATLTYRELDEKANQLSHLLIDKGINTESIVALALERSEHFIVALMATLKAGATYLPLDLKQPISRLNTIITSSQAALVIGLHSWFESSQCTTQAPTLCLEKSAENIISQTKSAPTISMSVNDSAYIIYTSGSTGTPKGVVIEHQSIVQYIDSVHHTFSLPIPANYALISTVAADLGHTQLYGALCYGGTLVLADEELSFNPLELANFFAEKNIDVMKLAPSHLRGLLNANNSVQLLPKHTLLFGGEALEQSLVDSVKKLSPNLRIVNHYGPTEATVGAVAQEVSNNHHHASLPLGKPLPHRTLFVLNEQAEPTPIGVPGELYIGGALARGYLHQPELTEQYFINKTFDGKEHRLYRTGDKVCWLSDGQLLFIGRTDNQVKIRGNRLELGEVETQIKQLTIDIEQVLVRLIKPEDKPSQLVAYIVKNVTNDDIDESETLSNDTLCQQLHDQLSLRVPDYMVPAHFIVLDTIPLTANGKIDYRNLPLPEARIENTVDYVAPRNEVEEILADIWQNVLKVERIGVHENFFSLGGDSILNLQIIARANQRGLKLTPKQLFEKRTIADIAALITGDGTIDLQKLNQDVAVALTAGQLSIINTGAFQATWRCISLNQAIDLEHLQTALTALQYHHETLQLVFKENTDNTWQAILPVNANPLPLSQSDSTSLTDHDINTQANDIFSTFNLAKGETFHARIINNADDNEQQLLLVAHPLSLDEASWPLLLTDMNLALTQIQYQRPPMLSYTGGRFSALSQHQQNYGQQELDESWEHWLQYVGMELPILDIPVATPETNNHTQDIVFDKAISQQLRRVEQTLQLNEATLISSAIAEQIALAQHHADSENTNNMVVINLNCGHAQARYLPLHAALSGAQLDPSNIAGSLSVSTPMFLSYSLKADTLQQVQDLDESLRAHPQHGSDYGVLRYLSDNSYMQEPLLSLPKAQVEINIIGDWDTISDEQDVFKNITQTSVGINDTTTQYGYALTINAYWQDGCLRLICQGPLAESWVPTIHEKLTSLATLLENKNARPNQTAFPLCPISINDLEKENLDWSNVENIYPLSPMQHGMLLHTLLEPHGGVYLMQQRYTWKGTLNRAAFESAWDTLMQRHAVIRTGFIWRDDHEPLQCVYRQTDRAYEWYDWQHLDEASQHQKIDLIMAEERQRGFNMARAPLTFMRVFHLGEDNYAMTRSFHHILTDAWCFGVLLEDMLAIYDLNNQTQALARPLVKPFSDYIHWLSHQDEKASQHFWTTELEGITEATPLSLSLGNATVDPLADNDAIADNSTNDDTNEEVGDHATSLSSEQNEKLLALCRQHQLTPNTWIQGAWALLLARYSGNEEVMFGVTVAGRPTDMDGVEGIVGIFVNSLPLRVKADNEKTVAQWLQAILTRNAEIREFEHAPLVDIQRWSELAAGQSLFNSLVVFENAPLDKESISELDIDIDIYDDRVHTNFPLTLVAYPTEPMCIRFSYDSQLFTQATIERMLDHLMQCLGNMIDQPDALLNHIDVIDSHERHQLLHTWNQTHDDFSDHQWPLSKSYAELFALQVQAQPDSIAVVYEEERLSYAELDRRSNCVAQRLIAAGAKPDVLVALAGERSASLLIMMIATLKTGAAFQTLDILHPTQRLGELMQLSEPAIVLLTESTKALIDEALEHGGLTHIKHADKYIIAETLWANNDKPSIARNIGSVNDLAYVIFTSGSTGTPKGVMIEQKGMLNNIFGKVPSLGLHTKDNIAQTASPAFDISIWQFLAAPVVGACVHILPNTIAHDPTRLLDAIEQNNLTIIESVPAMIQGMLQESDELRQLNTLRWLLPTGEALPPALCQQWFARFPNIPMMNAYGPAECSDDVAFYPITQAPEEDCVHMPIGRPTANNQIFILDDQQQPTPIGISGEICISGIGVGRGYIKDPERTADVFITNPFVEEDHSSPNNNRSSRLYRSGDVGRYRQDGVIEYLGRKDQQIKIRGHRIELGEIENRLAKHDTLQTAAVVAIADQQGMLSLIAFYVLKDAAEEKQTDDQQQTIQALQQQTLKHYLSEQLAEYMIPSRWVCLDKLPLSANGKIDRKTLMQKAAPIQSDQEKIIIAPRTEIEITIAGIWNELLDNKDISIDDNFFELGGHSLLATQVISRIRRRLNIELPLRAIFEYNSIETLAQAVELAKNTSTTDSLTAIEKIPSVSREHPLPLSYAQQRLWFVDQLEGPSSTYNVSTALKLTGELNLTAIEAAANALLDRHEPLRTCFRLIGASPKQVVVNDVTIPIHIQDFSSLEMNQQDIAVQEFIDAEENKAFDLAQSPMIRVALIKLGEQQHIAQFTLHHITTDIWSTGILVKDFMFFYLGFVDGLTPQLPPLAIQYGDYAHWQRSDAQQQNLSRSINYWRNQLHNVPMVIDLPFDQARPKKADYEGASITHQLSAEQVKKLNTYAQQSQGTLFMVLLNAFNSVLQRACDNNDFIVGTDLANREHPDLEGLIGFFINVLPMRTQFNGDESFSQRFDNLRNNLINALEHQRVPFDKLVEELQPPRQNGVNPLVQVLFASQDVPATKTEFPNLDIEILQTQQETCKFDLGVFTAEAEDKQLSVRWLYRKNLFNAQTIEQFKQGFESLLALVADDAENALEKWDWQPTLNRQLMHNTSNNEASSTLTDESKNDNHSVSSKKSRKKSKLSKLKSVKATRVSHAPHEQVTLSGFEKNEGKKPKRADSENTTLPLIIEPKLAELDPVTWAEQSKPWIEALLNKNGGLLFRGFNLPDAKAFEQFAQALEPSLYGQYGDLPKNKSGKNIYHSTPYPEEQMILFHNESSHLTQWPKKQWFYCETPSPEGGCTPIVDCRQVYQQLPADIIKTFEEKGLLYVRHFTDKLDVRWQDFFKTDNREDAEEKCKKMGMRCEWYGDDNLRTEQYCPAISQHSDTHEPLFFNQVQLHHEACLEPEVRANLIELFGADRLPRNVYYGDGSTISDDVMAEVGRAYEACAVRFEWKKMDIVMLDNMLVAHARDPFKGERKICVAMGQIHQRDDVQASPSEKIDERKEDTVEV